MGRNNHRHPPRSSISWTGIVLAFALNLLLVTLGLFVAQNAPWPHLLENGLILILALLAGVMTGFYVQRRSAIHAFIGGMLSALVLMIFILPGNWSFSLLAGALCAAGGILVEYNRTRR